MNPLVVLILVGNFLLCQSGSIQRNKRGYLSRTGICANPKNNFQIKDPRLNFWGVAYVLPDDENPKCTESECKEDSDCDADRKCCKNYCGGMVCTPTTRDPDPCKKFQCPTGQTCKVQYVPCVMPKCADAIAVNRPTCIKDPSAAAPAGPPTPPYPSGGAAPQAPMYPAQPPMYQKKPLSYQLPQVPLPQVPPYQQAPFSQLPMPAPMEPVGQMAGFHNDEPESDVAPETELVDKQPSLTAGFNDALGNALQNENQPINFQNESPLNSDQSNFFPPPVEQQLASEPASQFPAGIYPAAPGTQHAWDRSSKVQ